MVESGVSLLFAVGIEPGWHTTIYPPYFLIEAVQEGFAVVILISITLRAAFSLRQIVTDRHLEMLAQLLLLFSLMTTYCYIFEAFDGWYSGDEFERQTLWGRAFVTYPWTYWSAMLCTVFAPNVLWFRTLRRKVPVLALVALMVTVGVWLGHFTEVESALARDYLPAAWRVYTPVGLGVDAARRHDRALVLPVLPVRAPAADDLDVRAQGSAARRHAGDLRWRTGSSSTPCWRSSRRRKS